MHNIDWLRSSVWKSFVLLFLFQSMGCGSTHLTGTSHSIILKPASLRDRYYGSFSLIKADEWQNGRGRLTPLSYGSVDQTTGALRFTLPMPDALSGEQAICLMIVGNGGPVSVRSGSSGMQQYTFRNPLWEAELQRLTTVKRAEHEIQKRAGEERAARIAVEQSEQPLKVMNARSPQECREGDPVPIPPRPIDALAEAERKPAADGVCAAAWEEILGETAGIYYQLANRPDVWKGRKAELSRQQRMNYYFRPPAKNLNALRVAPQEGERWMYYSATVDFFQSLTAGCETRVAQAFADETARWEQAIHEARAAPAKALAYCREVTAVHQEAAQKWHMVEASLAQQETVLKQLRQALAKSTESESLIGSICR